MSFQQTLGGQYLKLPNTPKFTTDNPFPTKNNTFPQKKLPDK